jgi:hypothetical protein
MNIYLWGIRFFRQENLCALRGLENGSDLQTFVCSFPRAFRDRVDQILAGLRTTTGGAAVALNLRATAAPAAIAAGHLINNKL